MNEISLTLNYNVLIIVFGFIVITKMICNTIEAIHGITRDFTIDLSPNKDKETKQ